LDGQSHHLPGLVPALPEEGLTVFRDQEFSGDMRSRPMKRIVDVRGLRAAQFIEDAGPLVHPVRPEQYKEINNFYTSTVYEKGAELVRMIQTLIGKESFRKGMDLYFARHDGEAATVEQFVQCFADASGRDMREFMRWYSQAGTPLVRVTTRYDAEAKTFTLDCKQTLAPTPGQPSKQPMPIPLRTGLIGKDGKDLPLFPGSSATSDVLELTEAAQTFTFINVPERPVLSTNRGFSAPIKLETDLADDDFALLAAHDRDPFNRWQALQTISTRLLIQNTALLRSGQAVRADDRLIAALARLLEDQSLEHAFVALSLVPPDEGDVAREIGHDIDPDAIYRAREALRVDIGTRLGPALSTIYDRLATSGGYSPDAASAGRRSVRNVALDLMAAPGAPDAIARAARQYEGADNMTDRMAALNVLSQHDVSARDRTLEDFYSRYAEDALVIDKWFALQATAPRPETLQRVKVLTAHPGFSMTNPNRVRSLIGAFAQDNATQFNRADGAGYEYIADVILTLDPKNPQVASRMTTAFRTWRTLEPGRQAKAEAALRRIQGTGGLSRDVSDIVERALA
jgi:aminopeptidase N